MCTGPTPTTHSPMAASSEIALQQCNQMLENPETCSVKEFFIKLLKIPRFESDDPEDPCHQGIKLFSHGFQSNGIMSLKKLLALDKLTTQQLAGRGGSDAWVETFTDLVELPLLAWEDLEAPSASMQGCELGETSAWRPAAFHSPDKKLICLGEELRRSGTLDELKEFFKNPGVFAEIIVAQPQLVALRHPMDAVEARSALTIIFVSVAARFGSVNMDKLAARHVMKGLHQVGLILPPHGSTKSLDRKGWQVLIRRFESGRRQNGCASHTHSPTTHTCHALPPRTPVTHTRHARLPRTPAPFFAVRKRRAARRTTPAQSANT